MPSANRVAQKPAGTVSPLSLPAQLLEAASAARAAEGVARATAQ
jgi:hypothetical protein